MADTPNSQQKPSLNQENDQRMRNILTRVGVPGAIVVAAMFIFSTFLSEDQQDKVADWFGPAAPTDTINVEITDAEDEIKEEEAWVDTLMDYFPNDSSVVVDHEYFTLSYSEPNEQAEWVAYELSGANLRTFAFQRRTSFRKDPKVPTESASSSHYTNSGYDRGHLAPAADMAYSEEAMKRSFYMSNVSPQLPGFNRGIWKELEEQTRDWARGCEHLYVVTGPVLTKKGQKTLKGNVLAPAAFYKILLDLQSPSPRAAAFLMPNESSDERLSQYMISIDSLEAITGIDFFPELPDNMEATLEADDFIGKWPYDEQRYQLRVSLWNQQARMASLARQFE
ncbi:MAG: DNA/RNA non-specific endonuclease [Bacteroidota bacterium]